MIAAVRKMKKLMISGLIIIDGGCQTVAVKVCRIKVQYVGVFPHRTWKLTI